MQMRQRFLLILLAGLAACSPQFDWRPVTFGLEGARGVLPDKVQSQTRAVDYETHSLPLTMHSARAGGVLFALGAAPLPEALGQDAAARARLAEWAIRALYHNVGATPPERLPASDERFTIRGETPQGAVQVQARIRVSRRQWLEAVVIGEPSDFEQAPVEDFWLSLRWAAHPGPAASFESRP